MTKEEYKKRLQEVEYMEEVNKLYLLCQQDPEISKEDYINLNLAFAAIQRANKPEPILKQIENTRDPEELVSLLNKAILETGDSQIKSWEKWKEFGKIQYAIAEKMIDSRKDD